MLTQIEWDRKQSHKDRLALNERINTLEREVRAFNVRIQGIPLDQNQNVKAAVVKTLSKVVTSLKNEHIEFAIKIKAKDTSTTAPMVTGEALVLQQAAPKKPPPSIVLVRFTTKAMRNNVFFTAKKDGSTEKFGTKIIIREDMIKCDWDS